jgi:hypothetical protein
MYFDTQWMGSKIRHMMSLVLNELKINYLPKKT